MPTIRTSTEVAAAPEQVWALVSDLSRYGEWNVAHAGFPDGTPVLAAGQSYHEDLRIMGTPGRVRWTVADVDAPHRLELSGSGPMGVTLGQVLSLTGTGAGTVVQLETSFDGGPVVGPMGDAVAHAGQQAADESLQRLTALV